MFSPLHLNAALLVLDDLELFRLTPIDSEGREPVDRRSDRHHDWLTTYDWRRYCEANRASPTQFGWTRVVLIVCVLSRTAQVENNNYNSQTGGFEDGLSCRFLPILKCEMSRGSCDNSDWLSLVFLLFIAVFTCHNVSLHLWRTYYIQMSSHGRLLSGYNINCWLILDDIFLPSDETGRHEPVDEYDREIEEFKRLVTECISPLFQYDRGLNET